MDTPQEITATVRHFVLDGTSIAENIVMTFRKRPLSRELQAFRQILPCVELALHLQTYPSPRILPALHALLAEKRPASFVFAFASSPRTFGGMGLLTGLVVLPLGDPDGDLRLKIELLAPWEMHP